MSRKLHPLPLPPAGCPCWWSWEEERQRCGVRLKPWRWLRGSPIKGPCAEKKGGPAHTSSSRGL